VPDITAEDLRAEVARRQVPLYVLGAAVGLHPSRLGQMLSERLAVPPALAERVLEALGEIEPKRAA
jgi:hypothetical protein